MGEGDKERLTFAANEKWVRFVAPAPQYSHGAGLMTYVLAAELIDERHSLTLRYAPFDPGSDEVNEHYFSEPIILASGFEGIGFQYYGAPTDDDDATWQTIWQDDADNFPSAIFIRTRAEPDSDGWPDLVFELHSGGSS